MSLLVASTIYLIATMVFLGLIVAAVVGGVWGLAFIFFVLFMFCLHQFVSNLSNHHKG